jgi:hypothetical protein
MAKRNRKTPPRSPNPKTSKQNKDAINGTPEAHRKETKKNSTVPTENTRHESNDIAAAAPEYRTSTTVEHHCTAYDCIGLSSSTIKTCSTFQCTNTFHDECGTNYGLSSYCDKCSDRHNEHDFLTTPSNRDKVQSTSKIAADLIPKPPEIE